MLLFGGGVQSTSVAEVPENITKMIKNNYKKIAEVRIDGSFSVTGNGRLTKKISFTPPNFKYKEVFIRVYGNHYNDNPTIMYITKENLNLMLDVGQVRVTFKEITNNSITFELYNLSSYSSNVAFTKIIFIE